MDQYGVLTFCYRRVTHVLKSSQTWVSRYNSNCTSEEPVVGPSKNVAGLSASSRASKTLPTLFNLESLNHSATKTLRNLLLSLQYDGCSFAIGPWTLGRTKHGMTCPQKHYGSDLYYGLLDSGPLNYSLRSALYPANTVRLEQL